LAYQDFHPLDLKTNHQIHQEFSRPYYKQVFTILYASKLFQAYTLPHTGVARHQVQYCHQGQVF